LWQLAQGFSAWLGEALARGQVGAGGLGWPTSMFTGRLHVVAQQSAQHHGPAADRVGVAGVGVHGQEAGLGEHARPLRRDRVAP
jgi:hypothetical protein